MRTLLAVALILSGTLALAATAEARKGRGQGYDPRHHYQPYYGQPRGYDRAPGYSYGYRPQRRYLSRERAICEERAQNEDPSGQYAGFPCWAREAFGRGSGGRR